MPAPGSQEKTEQPTPKRLRDARKKGQVSKSRDLEGLVVLLSAFAALAFSKSFISSELRDLMEAVFRAVSQPELTVEEMYSLGKLAFLTMIRVTAPFAVTTVLVAAIVGFLQVGPVFSMESVKPQTKRLNAVENLRNMLKPKILFELFKNIVKVGVIFLLAYSVLKGMLEPFLLTVTAPLEGASKIGGLVVTRFIIRFLVVFLLVSILDFFIQRREYMKNLRMTKEEVKREYKEDEGDPLIKAHRRQIHMEMAMGDVKKNVKNADAVITNPTHLAIALKYDKETMAAPQVVAKGQRLFAEYIRDLAKEFDVPIIQNVPLAWALIELEVEDEIPETLYIAVAEILTFVYRLKEEREKGRIAPPPRPPRPEGFKTPSLGPPSSGPPSSGPPTGGIKV